ncbi:MAG: hypothetical protein IT356_12055 [Gemmatimonadaceae bacterium]|nr:hypothetical protein [Gemmatimonadaceae bacterium]
MTQSAIGTVPWQVTGNHWMALPCVHPADGALHAIGLLHRGARSSVEFAGSSRFLDADGPALARPTLRVDGEPVEFSSHAMAWERSHHWIPTFTATAGSLVIRGSIFAPYGRDVDVAGAVYAVAVENRGGAAVEASIGIEGTLGHRQLRVRTPRPITSAHIVSSAGDGTVVLEGDDAPGFAALAISSDDGSTVAVKGAGYSIQRQVAIGAGQRADAAFYIGAGPERDGALATVAVLRKRGWKHLLGGTRDALGTLEQSSGVESLDGLINRHLMFAYFYSAARALDDAQYYVVRSRAPWATHGTTIRDWEALAWTVPAVQLADPPLARELILRICEVHGYAPGQGVDYFDGTLFSPGATLEGAAAYPIATDRYIRDTEDDAIVEEPVLADTLYLAADEIAERRDEHYPLYRADVALSGVPSELFSLHANAAVAYALDCLSRMLDEGEVAKLQDAEAVRAAIRRHFVAGEGSKAVFAASAEPGGRREPADDPGASVLWLPLLEAVERTDSVFRRSARAAAPSPRLEHRLARLMGPDAGEVLDWLRRAPLDRGFAAEFVDDLGEATGGGGDAALSGLLAYTVWFAAHAYGVRP